MMKTTATRGQHLQQAERHGQKAIEHIQAALRRAKVHADHPNGYADGFDYCDGAFESYEAAKLSLAWMMEALARIELGRE